MNTVITKLKCEVDNDNLMVIDDNGNVSSLYVAKYSNILKKLGVELDSDKRNFFESFIKQGEEEGWLGKIVYMLPFYGDISFPMSGAVPLIDRVGNYEMAEYDGTENYSLGVFATDENNIIAFQETGNITESIKTPLSTNILGGVNVMFCLEFLETEFMESMTNSKHMEISDFKITKDGVLGTCRNRLRLERVEGEDYPARKYQFAYPGNERTMSWNAIQHNTPIIWKCAYLLNSSGIVLGSNSFCDTETIKTITESVSYFNGLTNDIVRFGHNNSSRTMDYARIYNIIAFNEPIDDSTFGNIRNALYTLNVGLGKYELD